MNGLTQKERYNMEDLLEIVALLRDPENGCPWDKVQTHTSIRKNFIEETYEVADAIDLADASLLCEELGDVLLQVALHTRMEEEQGAFTFGDVCTGICKSSSTGIRIFWGRRRTDAGRGAAELGGAQAPGKAPRRRGG